MTFKVNMAGHDSDFAFTGRDDAGTVRTDQTRFLALQKIACANHVEGWNALRNADDEFDARVGCFHDRISRVRRRNEDHGRISAGVAPRFLDSIEDIDS